MNTFGGRLAEAVMALLVSGSLSEQEKLEISRHLKSSKTAAPKKAGKNVKPAAKKVAKKVKSKPAGKTSRK
jgi:hypothetical protein